MILIGRDLSPFVRRTATVLHLLEIDFERRVAATEADGELIRRFNPLGRLPVLVFADSLQELEEASAANSQGAAPSPKIDALADSHAIIAHAFELSPAGNSLLPTNALDRRRVQHLSALAVGAMEKAVASAYEVRMRPQEFVYRPYLQRLQGQLLLAGLLALEDALAQTAANLADAAASDVWFGGTSPSLADVDTVIAYDQAGIVARTVMADASLPRLQALSERANQLPAFAATRWQPEAT